MWRENIKMDFPAQKDYFISQFLIDKSENVLAVVCIKCEKVLFFVKNTLHYFKGC